MDGTSLASLGSGDSDDEDQPPNLGGEVLGGEDLANAVDGLLRDDGELLDDEAAAVDDDILAEPAAADGGQGRQLVRAPSRAGSVGTGRGRGGAAGSVRGRGGAERRRSSIHSTPINRLT